MAATILEQKQRRTAILEELKAYAKISTGRAFTEDERTKVDALKTENDTLKLSIGQAESDERTRGFISDLEKELAEPDGRRTQPDNLSARYDDQGRLTGSFEGTDETVDLTVTDDPRAPARKTYREACLEAARKRKQLGYKPCGRGGQFDSAGDFLRQLAKGQKSAIFESKLAAHYEKLAVAGMSEAVGSDGGVFVVPELSSRILDRVYNNDLWSRTDHYTVSGNSNGMVFNAVNETSRATGSRHGGLRGYWVPEGGTKTPSKPTFRQVTLKLKKLAVVVYLTDELLDDTTALARFVEQKAAEEINFMIGDALINGTGVGQPLGVLNWPGLVVASKLGSQTADTLETENIIAMYSRVFGPYRDSMIWNYNQDVEPELFTMTLGVGTGGVVTYMPPGGLSTAPYSTILGRPAFPTEFNPTLGDQGDILAWDPKQMISISKGGIVQAVSMHVEFLTDQTALRFVMRLDAGPWENSAITPYKGTNTQSSAVALEAR